MCAVKSMNNMWCGERGGKISEILMSIIIRGDGKHIRDSRQRVGKTLLDLTSKHILIGKDSSTSASCKWHKKLIKTRMTCLICRDERTNK